MQIQVMLLGLRVRIDRLVDDLRERLVERRPSAENGQSMVEYAIIVALIAVAGMGAIQLLGGGITTVFERIVGKLQGIGS